MTDQAALVMISAGLVLLVNVVTFALFGIDKHRARHGIWRVPERSLLNFALLGGSVGAVMGQRYFRHKTTKQPFARRLKAICFLHLGLAIALTFLAPRHWLLGGLS